MGTVFGQKLYQADIVRQHVNGPRLDLDQYTFVEVLDRVVHSLMLANMRTACKRKGQRERSRRRVKPQANGEQPHHGKV